MVRSLGGLAEFSIPKARHAWVHVARGKARIDGHELEAGDSGALSDEPTVRVDSIAASEVLVFDLG